MKHITYLILAVIFILLTISSARDNTDVFTFIFFGSTILFLLLALKNYKKPVKEEDE